MKLLLYCCKEKPYLVERLPFNEKKFYQCRKKNDYYSLNGKIVAECDFDVEEITYAPNPSAFERANFSPKEWGYDYQEKYGGLSNEELLKHSCLTNEELSDYLNTPTNDKKVFCKDTFGYAIHIKNLHIFDTPKGLDDFTTRTPVDYDSIICDSCTNFNSDCKKCRYSYDYQQVIKAPQNMMKVCEWDIEDKVLISIKSEYLCKILNGEKTIEIRRKVLKEMLGK